MPEGHFQRASLFINPSLLKQSFLTGDKQRTFVTDEQVWRQFLNWDLLQKQLKNVSGGCTDT
jgi:hypothetical protein